MKDPEEGDVITKSFTLADISDDSNHADVAVAAGTAAGAETATVVAATAYGKEERRGAH